MKTITASKLIAILAASFAISHTAALEVVLSEHRDKQSFQRISEFVTGDENPGRYMIGRSVPERRVGFYVGVKVTKDDSVEQLSSARILYVKPTSQEIHSSTMEISGPVRKRILIGLTEEEWANPKLRPQAWKIELLDASEEVLATVRSFLWSLDD